ncbi:universal stress protein [Pararhodospirillum oryzae]|uniref:Universal stress protein n=1 Tax=Pararhodospirillum oryzae TaxID=478448 RepID=A0A512H9A7_9PROT|nr:universal stress protein [Pararhodospirillum oryzae]GEO81980.1 universal stress protein [Pararhodospirillum oryzae]
MLVLPEVPKVDPCPDRQTAGDNRTFLVVVDETTELRAALRFAARRAQGTGGRVALVSVAQPPDVGPWMFVDSLMREEARSKAEQMLQRSASIIQSIDGEAPVLHVREGEMLAEVLALIDEDPSISILVLATAADDEDPGPLVRALTGRQAGRIRVPVTLVPGCLTDSEIDVLT